MDRNVTRLISGCSNDSENVKEQVNNVHVQVESCKNVLFRGNGVFMIPSHHHLRVVNYINGEEESSKRGVDKNHRFSREKHAYNTKHHQDEHSDKQYSSNCGKVDLRLESEKCKSNGNNKSDEGCVKHLKK
jgi:hypothetical protein